MVGAGLEEGIRSLGCMAANEVKHLLEPSSFIASSVFRCGGAAGAPVELLDDFCCPAAALAVQENDQGEKSWEVPESLGGIRRPLCHRLSCCNDFHNRGAVFHGHLLAWIRLGSLSKTLDLVLPGDDSTHR